MCLQISVLLSDIQGPFLAERGMDHLATAQDMSRMKNNPKFLDFDAIQGRKALSDTVAEIAPENTTLVLNIGDGDPDDSYSKVSYEKVSPADKGE